MAHPKTISVFTHLHNCLFPRTCIACGKRLSPTERTICAPCNYLLPRTDCDRDFLRNEMAQRFWARGKDDVSKAGWSNQEILPVERAFALIRHEPHANSSALVYQLKYGHNPHLGAKMGEFIGQELASTDFFEGITAIVPVPLTKGRQRERGYNQSAELARGISKHTHLPVITKALRRIHFGGSQTHKERSERIENVRGAFELVRPELLRGHHVLLVDDVVTTGATMTACIQQLLKVGDIRISVLSWGLASI